MSRIRRIAIATVSVAIAVALTAAGTTAASAGPALKAAAPAPGNLNGWTQDWVDNFDGPLNTQAWGRYHSTTNQHNMLSKYERTNVYTEDGNMVIRTYNAGGDDWRSGGVSGNPGFAGTMGKWTIRAKFDKAPGIGYAFLLYPRGGGWPPEVDIAEGTMGTTKTMATFHWTPENLTDSRFLHNIDLTQWHTYGVQIYPGKIEYTFDGRVWATAVNSYAPTMPMWLGLQAGAKAPGPKVTGEIVGPTTPLDSKIYIDWVAHWNRT